MSVFKYFKYIPRSPSHRATGPMCNFFFKFATKSLEKKKQALSPVGGATGACRPAHGRPPLGRPTVGVGGPVAPHPPRATGVSPLIKARALPFPPHLSPK